MEKLIKQGQKLAEKKETELRSRVKDTLDTAVPEHASVAVEGRDVIVSGRNMSDDILNNGDLRDVAFLMRAVR